jgi:uncharacterized protein (TIGR00297 family)
MPASMQLLLSAAIAAGVAWAAFRARALDRSGALAAAAVGTTILGFGGWPWALLLITFFSTSSALTRLLVSRKRGLEDSSVRGAGRDAGQVLGNGLLPAALALAHGLGVDARWTWPPFAAALAAVNADTWATELGALAVRAPRLITRPASSVPRGTSGGVTMEGFLAAALGAGSIGVLATVLASRVGSPLVPHQAIIIAACGFAGCLLDSILGATVQVMYYCPTHQKETEKHPLHTCGTRTRWVRGFRWLNNNVVNLSCAAFGAVLGFMFGAA